MLAKRICTILGIVFLLLGILGFVVHDLMGTHLSLAHNVVHLVSGAGALWLGLKGTVNAARTFCLVFGLVYLLLGVAGYAAGSAGDPSTGVPGPSDARMLKVLPGMLEFGSVDHMLHVLIGVLFLIGGLATRKDVVVARA